MFADILLVSKVSVVVRYPVMPSGKKDQLKTLLIIELLLRKFL